MVTFGEEGGFCKYRALHDVIFLLFVCLSVFPSVHLHEEAITLLLNITRQQPFPKVLLPGIRCIRVSLSDLPHEPLLEHLTPCVEAIEDEYRRGGCTLVYCKNARSRSASVCLAYLMHYEDLSLSDALQVRYQDPITPPMCKYIQFYPNFTQASIKQCQQPLRMGLYTSNKGHNWAIMVSGAI
uniref:Dual specificity phosphatase 28 n=1 Tax=Eptatretus burgeri TaxID=7764 RepID=A0A8C4RAJ5_EPTBU